MDHSYFKDRISAYHDQELKPYEHQVVEEHLATCDECRKLLEDYAVLEEFVSVHIELDKDSDYWEKTAQKIESELGFTDKEEKAEKKITQMSGLWWKVTAVAASLAFLTFIGLHESEISDSVKPQVEAEEQIQTLEDKLLDISSDTTGDLEPPASTKEPPKQKESQAENLQKVVVAIPDSNQQKKDATKMTLGNESQESTRESRSLQPLQESVPLTASKVTIRSDLTSKSRIIQDGYSSVNDSFYQLYQQVSLLLKSETENDDELTSFKSSKKSAASKSISQVPDWELKTLEAFFQFGINANKENDRKSAIDFLEDYLSNDRTKFKDKGQVYLDSLKMLNQADLK